MHVDGIILAAGLSKRFGRPKQLANWRGTPLVLHIAETALASQLRSVVVVIGHAAAEVRQTLEPVADNAKVKIVLNPDYHEGQASSIRRGLSALPTDAQAAMFFTCDQPLLTPLLIDALLESFAAHRPLVCYPVHELMRGSPTIFAAELFPELMRLTGDVGGRVLIEKYRARVHEHPLASAKPLADIDTEEDLTDLAAQEGEPDNNDNNGE
jgi:molybdenum cofactor cytidylyltransferase